jgi:hypothetical protein
MDKNPNLSDVEKINLLKLAMKANDLNPNLRANGIFEDDDIMAARAFIKIEDTQYPVSNLRPDVELVKEVLEILIANDRLPARIFRRQYSKKAMELFFADHNITL